MKKFQIRAGHLGVALYRGEDAKDALMRFLADTTLSGVRDRIATDADGVAAVEFRGETYQAVPVLDDG